jgi:carbon-monoxide dehydrogenase medium subunit
VTAAGFEYFAPPTVEEAVALLARWEGAKLLAGGQSLLPLLTMRLAAPPALVDIGRVAGLRHLRREGDGLVIGATVRHQEIVTSPVVLEACPLLGTAAAEIGHLHVRNRGTIGGSLAHADPAAEYLTAGLALDAGVTVVGPRGTRGLPVRELVVGPLTTVLASDEVLTEVRIPALPPGAGWSFRELALRRGDFALVEVAVVVSRAEGRAADVRVAVGGATSAPIRCPATEARLGDQPLTPALAAEAGRWAAAELADPLDDIHADATYRVEITAILVRDALVEAWGRALGATAPPGCRR